MSTVMNLRALDAFNACEGGMETIQPGAEFSAPEKVAVDLIARGLAVVVEVIEIPAIVEEVQAAVTGRKKPSHAQPT